MGYTLTIHSGTHTPKRKFFNNYGIDYSGITDCRIYLRSTFCGSTEVRSNILVSAQWNNITIITHRVKNI